MKLSPILPILLCALVAGCASGGNAPGVGAIQAYAQPTPQAEQPLGAGIVEAMAGGLIGGAIGSELDGRERRRALEAEYRALEYTPAGEAVEWESGRRAGNVRAGAPYRVGSQDCRQYIHTVSIAGREQSARGTACRNDDGSWTPLV